MIKCEYCGYEIPDDNAKFCSSCGKPIKNETTKLNVDNINIISLELKNNTSEELENVINSYYASCDEKILAKDNDYWTYILALLFWDIIFMKTDTCTTVKMDDPKFEGLYQFMVTYTGLPNDFFTDEFYPTRKEEIDNRLAQLETEDLEKKILESFEENFGKPSKLITLWDKFPKEKLSLISQITSNEDLLKIQKRLLMDFIGNRATLPSTIVYKDEAKLVDIITNDELSENQLNWYKFIKSELNLNLDLILFNKNETELEEIKNKL